MLARALLVLSLLLLQVYTAYCIGSDSVTITPADDEIVPVTSTRNITFECTVGPGYTPEWSVNSFQLLNPEDDLVQGFAAAGIFIEILSDNTTRLIVSQLWRVTNTADQDQSTLLCECTAVQRFKRGETVQAVRVITYGRPAVLANLQLVSLADGLTLVWDRPTNIPASVPITYNVSILNVTGDIAMPYESASVTTASYNIHDLESSLQGQPCQEFQFTVVPSNEAGVGSTAVYNETVPVSANTSAIDATRELVFLELGENGLVIIIVRFLTVESCSPNYPVLEYTLTLNNQVALTVPASDLTPNTLTTFTINSTQVPFSIQQNSVQRLVVVVRSAVSERSSQSLIIQTTSVQSAEVVFYQTNVFLSCVFASRTLSQGCLFRFSPNENGTGQQEFFLPKDIDMTNVTSCNTTMNQRSAYLTFRGAITVFMVEEGGNLGSITIFPRIVEIENSGNFTLDTGCPLRQDTDPPVIVPVAAIAVPVVLILLFIIICLVAVFIAVFMYCLSKKREMNFKSENMELQGKYEAEKNKSPRMEAHPDGTYGVLNVHTGDLLDEDIFKKPLTPSASSGSSITGSEAAGGPPPIPSSSSADQLDVHYPGPTGSTGSGSPPKHKKQGIDRSLSEGAEPRHAVNTEGRGIVHLLVRRNSLDIKVRQEQLLEELQRRRREQQKVKSKMIKSRSRSMSNDSNLSREETAPLLGIGVTLSEIQFSEDLLHPISEEQLNDLDTVGEESNEYTNPTYFTIGSDTSTGEYRDTAELVPNGQGSGTTTTVEIHTAGETEV